MKLKHSNSSVALLGDDTSEISLTEEGLSTGSSQTSDDDYSEAGPIPRNSPGEYHILGEDEGTFADPSSLSEKKPTVLPGLRKMGEDELVAIEGGQYPYNATSTPANLRSLDKFDSTKWIESLNRPVGGFVNTEEMEKTETDLQDVEQLILHSLEPPNTKYMSMRDALNTVKRKKYQDKQFSELQDRLSCNIFTLAFSKPYEEVYAKYLHETATHRVRRCILIALGPLLLTYIIKTVNNDESLTINLIRFVVVFPLLLGILAFTYVRRLDHLVEWYTAAGIFIVGVELVVRKILTDQEGPVLEYYVLFVFCFGITRMRFKSATTLAFSLLALYIIPVFIWGADATSALMFQMINFISVIISGLLGHYRQEILRRRNCALCLPFCGVLEDEMDSILWTDKFSEQKLMENYTLKFKNEELEQAFYQYWYLIDKFPFEHPNAGILHEGAFHIIKYAVGGAVLGQVALSFQDVKFLLKNDEDVSYAIATGLRYGVVIPFYLSSLLLISFLSRRFLSTWIKQTTSYSPVNRKRPHQHHLHRPHFSHHLHHRDPAEEGSDVGKEGSEKSVESQTASVPAALPSLAHEQVTVEVDSSVLDGTKSAPIVTTEGMEHSDMRDIDGTDASSSRAGQEESEDAQTSGHRHFYKQHYGSHKAGNDESWWTRFSPSRLWQHFYNWTYVKKMQLYSAVVIAVHGFCMGAILLLVDDGATSITVTYLLGLLNAILFAHRSGFRVRFQYATYGTGTLSIVLIILAIATRSSDIVQFAAYGFVVLVLGMMNSYEEELLRRKFFVLRSIRWIEFEKWYNQVVKVQGWIREHMRKKMQKVRSRLSEDANQNDVSNMTEQQLRPSQLPRRMGKAGQLSMYSQLVNITTGILSSLG